MSIINAIEEALERHLTLYGERPIMVLVGPSELEGLVSEIASITELKRIAEPLYVFNMIVVPKCGNGIDFQVSCSVSQQVTANKLKQAVARDGN